jgi:hypothetical protein
MRTDYAGCRICAFFGLSTDPRPVLQVTLIMSMPAAAIVVVRGTAVGVVARGRVGINNMLVQMNVSLSLRCSLPRPFHMDGGGMQGEARRERGAF